MKKLLLLSAIFTYQTLVAQNVGIGTAAPLGKLHISTGASGNITPFSPLVVEGNNNTYINLLSPNTNETAVLFGKADNAASGAIVYNNVNALNGFQFRTNGNITQMILNNAGNLGIGLSTPNAKLSISADGTELVGTASGTVLRTNAGNLANVPGDELSLANIGFLSSNHSSLGIRAYRTSPGTGWEKTAILLGMDVDNTVRAGGGFLAIGANGNIGISTATPGFPLSFGESLGDKISLWSNSTNSYGFGIQTGLLQIHTDVPGADIAFGYGSSDFLTENMRIKGNGRVGIGNSNPAYLLDISNRMRIRSGGNNSVSAGVWLNNNANTEAAFIGMEDDTHVGFYGIGSGWKFGMNTQTGALKINGTEGTAGQILRSSGTGAPAWVTPVKYVQGSNGLGFSLINNGDEDTISSVTVTLTQNSFVEVYGTVGLNAFSNAHIYLLLTDTYGTHIVAANPNVLGITTMGFVYRTGIAYSAGIKVFTLTVKKIIGGVVVNSTGYTNPYASPEGTITAKVIPE